MTFFNSTPAQEAANERKIDFATRGHLYQLHPDAQPNDVREQLSARLSQLSSMLVMIHGGGFDNFESWSDEIKQNYLWGCSMLADECRELERHL